MKHYTNDELKIAWLELWNTDANDFWAAINTELARRLSRDEYAKFTDWRKS